MKIESDRVLKHLKNDGFWLSWKNTSTCNIVFARESHIPEFFESVRISSQGKKGEAVHASAAVSVLRGRLRTKILNESESLLEIGKGMPTYNTDRKWTIIENSDDAIVWEDEFASIAPTRVRELAAVKGAELLKRTEDIRRASAAYLSMLEPLTTVSEMLLSLQAQASVELQAEADRILNTAGVVWLREHEGRSLYPIAILAMLLFGDRIEGRPTPFADKKPLDDPEFMGRIQLIVDLLARPERKLV